MTRARCRAAVAFSIVFCAAVLSAQAPRPAAPAEQGSPLLDTLGLPVRFAHVFDQRIAYYEAGSGPVVILLPNLGWDSHLWAPNFAALAARYHVIAVDPLGFGRSDKPMIDYKMSTWTDVLAEFMKVKGIGGAVVAGAVMGGALSVQMALDYPHLVDGIIVAASNSGPGPHLGGVKPAPGRPSSPSLAWVRVELEESFFNDALITDPAVRARFAYRLRTNDGYVIQRHLSDHRAPYSAKELARIQVPALFVWCRNDEVTPLSWGEDYTRALASGTLAVLERCGHLPNVEQPAQFNRAVLAFLAVTAARAR